MNGQNKVLILQLVILVIIVVFFFINKSSSDASFKNAYKDAEQRLIKIEQEINTSQDLITKTKTQLDSIEGKVKLIKGDQKKSNETVAATNQEMEKKIRVQEAKIKDITQKYQAEQKEKQLLEEQLEKVRLEIENDI